ncbi:hypothetical protein [Thauera butanivorans]|uniref:hypothetical protein n=1 Tax=Thauera butanivorans TaxID=86174 RepID=UPI000837EE6C|nr:hypothetical protein [Thauera butanivorans]
MVPVTAYLTPAQASRLELLLAKQRDQAQAFDEHAFIDTVFSRGLAVAEQEQHAPPSPLHLEPTMQTSAPTPFAIVPDTTLPDGSIVPAFQVGRYLCSRSADGRAQVTADAAPWVEINYRDAVQACRDASFALITERQALALAWNVAQQPENWTGGAVGAGALHQGLHKWSVNSAQPGTYESPDPDERRWFVLSNGERVFDVAGNAFTWIHDDVQGDADGLIARPFATDSISLQAPFPSMEKGMGWRPEPGGDWSGDALIRGGCWRSGRCAGAFGLNYHWPSDEWGSVGFRCTR